MSSLCVMLTMMEAIKEEGQYFRFFSKEPSNKMPYFPDLSDCTKRLQLFQRARQKRKEVMKFANQCLTSCLNQAYDCK